jgi:hypothetical protein
MSANATWGAAPASTGGGKNASWGTPSSGSSSRKMNALLLGAKYGALGNDRSVSTDPSRLGNAVSTSALSDLAAYRRYAVPTLTSPVPEDIEDGEDDAPHPSSRRKAVKLRQETLESLGISVLRKSNAPEASPKSVLKKAGSSQALARSNTLVTLKRIPTEIELSNGRVLKRNTSVTFNERVRCKGVESAASLADDPKDLWFQDDEMKKFKRNVKKAVQAVELGIAPAESDTFSLRGIEKHISDVREVSRLRMEDTWDVVLGAQEVYLEHTGDYCDDEKLESLVRNISKQSLMEAQERAKSDAQEARQSMIHSINSN